MLSLRNIPRLITPALPRILSGAICSQIGKQRLHSDARPDLVIFDKNGTLVEFHDYWSPWIQNYVKRLEAKTNLALQEGVFERLDMCHFTGKARSGLVGHGTAWQVKREVQDILVSQGITRRKAQWIGDICWQESMPVEKSTVTPLCDLGVLFTRLKEQNIMIAICTSDSRWRTVKNLNAFGVGEEVDIMICGDDRDSVPKPDGHNIIEICRTLDVDLKKTCLVGDTPADMQMGRSAGVANIIGVLSGVGNRLELGSLAHHVLPNVTDAVELILDGHTDNTTIIDRLEARDGSKASLVIFDKDGTLLCFKSLWSPWAERVIERMEDKTGLQLRHRILEEWGYCHTTGSWIPGVFSEGTMLQTQYKAVEILQEHGYSRKEAETVIQESWDHSGFHSAMKIFDNPKLLFKILKENGIKVAICTADSRASTEQFATQLGLTPYLDVMVCGDDEESIPKPAAKNALNICSALKVDPADAIVVGDTTADLGMGRSAKLGATVGVLSGVGRVEDLDPLADHVIPSIKHVLSIALPQNDYKGNLCT